jgi:hypothetical protein
MVENILTAKTRKANVKFCEVLEAQILESLKDGKKEDSLFNILAFLVRHNVIRQSIVNRYLVITLYPDYITRFDTRHEAVKELSKVVPLEINAIYHILSNHYTYFHPNKMKI